MTFLLKSQKENNIGHKVKAILAGLCIPVKHQANSVSQSECPALNPTARPEEPGAMSRAKAALN
jgi:hypothetical protein